MYLSFFSDQNNKKVLGFEEHPDVITPNLDKLAKQSVVFDRAYCTTGICAPSRSSLMTGLYSRTMGLLSNGEKTEVMNAVVSLATRISDLPENMMKEAFSTQLTVQMIKDQT